MIFFLPRDAAWAESQTHKTRELSWQSQKRGCSLLAGGEEKNEPLTSPTQLPVLMDHVCQWGVGGGASAFLHFLTH